MKKTLLIIYFFILLGTFNYTYSDNSLGELDNICKVTKIYNNENELSFDLYFDIDSGKVLYFIQDGEGKVILVNDGNKSKLYNKLPFFEISKGGKHYVFLVNDNGKVTLVLDGKEINLYEDYNSLNFSQDGESFVYAGKKNGEWEIVLNNKVIGNKFKSVSYIDFSVDGKDIIIFGEKSDGNIGIEKKYDLNTPMGELDYIVNSVNNSFNLLFEFKNNHILLRYGYDIDLSLIENNYNSYIDNIFLNGEPIINNKKDIDFFITKPDDLFYGCNSPGIYTWVAGYKGFKQKNECGDRDYSSIVSVDTNNNLKIDYNGKDYLLNNNNDYYFTPSIYNISTFGNKKDIYYKLRYYKSKMVKEIGEDYYYQTTDIDKSFFGINDKISEGYDRIYYIKDLGLDKIELLVDNDQIIKKIECNISSSIIDNNKNNLITKNLILSKNELKYIKNGEKYINLIDGLNNEKLKLIEGNVKKTLDKYEKKSYLSQSENNSKLILNYLYYKILYSKDN